MKLQLVKSDCPSRKGSATIEEFKRIAKACCEECQVVVHLWQNYKDHNTMQRETSLVVDDDIKVDIRSPHFYGDDFTIYLLQAVKNKKNGLLVEILLAKYILYGSPAQSCAILSEHRYTSLGRLLRVTQSWLSLCSKEHTHCAVTKPGFRPRRLINVGGHESHPFLTENPVDQSPYAALSYCWGPIKCTFATNRQNLNQHFDEINYSSLPNTVRDAIVVCRCLNIPYLWVDALCIVQNDIDDQDWYEQSLHMGSIYSDAYLVISVDGASHSNEGFLPDEAIYSWEKVPTRDTKETGSVRLIREAHDDDDKKTLCGTKSLQTQPLSTRGWSMQECILPHRVLHFAKKELIWECNTSRTCECGRPEVHELWKDCNYSLINYSHLRPDDEEDSVHVLDFLHGKSDDSICWVWERLVELYSKRCLTVPGDKLAAFSGLATSFQERLHAKHSRYFAGVWDVNLPVGLLWYVSGTPVSSRPKDWRAPTWSWASLDGGIRFFHERYQFRFQSSIQIIEVVCVPKSVDLFGKIKKAYMRMRGYLAAVKLKIVTQIQDYSGQFNGLNGKPSKAFKNQTATVRKKGGGSRAFEVLPDLHIDIGTYDTNLYCLELGRHSNGLRFGGRTWWLLLRKTGIHQSNVAYERIGIGSFDSSSRDMDLCGEGEARQSTELVIL